MRTARMAIAPITMKRAIPVSSFRPLLLAGARNSTERHLGPEVIDTFEDELRWSMHLDSEPDHVRVMILGLFLVAVPGADGVVLGLVLPPILNADLLHATQDGVGLPQLVAPLVLF